MLQICLFWLHRKSLFAMIFSYYFILLFEQTQDVGWSLPKQREPFQSNNPTKQRTAAEGESLDSRSAWLLLIRKWILSDLCQLVGKNIGPRSRSGRCFSNSEALPHLSRSRNHTVGRCWVLWFMFPVPNRYITNDWIPLLGPIGCKKGILMR